MAFNGSGTFNRLHDWTDERDASNPISATKMDAEDDGFATGLSNCLTKDGQTTVTSNLPMATYRHTGVGNAVARTDYASAADIQDASLITLGTVAGTVNAITANASPAITAYAVGQLFAFIPAGANTGNVTININGVGNANILSETGKGLAAGELDGNAIRLIQYKNATNFTLVGSHKQTIGDLTGQSSLAVTVLDTLDYDFEIFGKMSTDATVLIRVSNDAGANYTSTTADNREGYLANDGASGAVAASQTATGHTCTPYQAESDIPVLIRGSLQGLSGYQASIVSMASYERAAGGAHVNSMTGGAFANHADGVDRFQVALSAGTWTAGQVKLIPRLRGA